MDPVAFWAPIGDSIPFPAMYRDRLKGQTKMAKVIVLFEDDEEDREWKEKVPFEPKVSVHTKSWKFDREEANER